MSMKKKLSARIPMSLHDAARAGAAAQGKSLTACVVEALTEYLTEPLDIQDPFEPIEASVFVYELDHDLYSAIKAKSTQENRSIASLIDRAFGDISATRNPNQK